MDAQAILQDFARRGIRLIPNPPKLAVEPASRLTDTDRDAIRRYKADLLALLSRPATAPSIQESTAATPPATPPTQHRSMPAPSASLVGPRVLDAMRRGREAEAREQTREQDVREDEVDRIAQADGWRPPVAIPPETVAEIARIEPEALRLGWRPERLWRFEFWPHSAEYPRGLASVMTAGDRIAEVTSDCIVIVPTGFFDGTDGRRLYFWRTDA